MSKLLLTCLAAIATLAPTLMAQSPADYFPLRAGDEWTYQVAGSAPLTTHRMWVTSQAGAWTRISGFEGDHTWRVAPGTGRVIAWNAMAGVEALVFDLALGSGWTMNPQAIGGAPDLDGSTWRVASTRGSVHTPAGRFVRCVVLENVRPVRTASGRRRLVFAPGVGLVEFSEQTSAGIRVFQLLRAVVGGIEHSCGSGYRLVLRLDRAVYPLAASAAPTGRISIPTPSTLRAQLDLHNDTAEDVSLEVLAPSSRHEIVLRDSNQQVVAQYLALASIAMPLPPPTRLPAGEVMRLGMDPVPLTYQSGAPLPAGQYSIEIVSDGGFGGEMRASAVFRIEKR